MAVLLFCIAMQLLLSGCSTIASIGINYGQIGDNLLRPEKVVPLVQSIGASRVKLYDANPRILRAFAGKNIEIVVGLGNEYLSSMRDPDKAAAWIKSNVQSYLHATNVTCITVGNEVLTFNSSSLTASLLPALQGLHSALVTLGLDRQIRLTTAHSLAILETSYPPSSGSFRRDLKQYIYPVLSFLDKIGSPLFLNAYPYFAYKGDPKGVPLDYVLFQSSQGMVDPVSRLRYDNMLFAQIDAVHYALADLGFKKLPIEISETGWPSKGDDDEAGATLDNARAYNNNLIKIVSRKKGTPMRPNSTINVFVFALFNENLKSGPTSERNYGLFKPDGTPAYAIGAASSIENNGTTVGTSGNGIGNHSTPPPSHTAIAPAAGYLSVSSSEGYFFRNLLDFWCFPCWILLILLHQVDW